MLKRNLTAAILVAIALFFLLFLRTLLVECADILFYAFMLFGAFEMWQVGRKSGYRALPVPLLFFAITLYPFFWFFSIGGIFIALCLAVLCAMTDFLFERRKYEFNDLLYTFLIFLYPMMLCGCFLYINHTAGNLLGIFFVLFVTLLSDAFALFAGMLFGKKKLMEDVSPKKTRAGLYGAYFGGLLGATIVLLLFDVFAVFSSFGKVGILRLSDRIGISIPVYLLLAVFSTTLAVVGDLVASLLKRRMGIKDFGKIFPGHGGVMDRLDSLLFVAPFFVAFFTVWQEVML